MSTQPARRHLFDWFKAKEQTGNPTKIQPRRPAERDLTDSLTINSALTRGLYHGSYPGLKLASAMAFTPIAIPIWFMGLPTPQSEDKNVQATLDSYLSLYARAMQQIHLQCHREGTCWIWPHYSARKQIVIWEFIPDETVTDVIRDLDTGDVMKIITDEQIKVSTDYEKTADVRRKRTFTAEKIVVEWLAGATALPANLRNISARNPLGAIPIAFANNRDGDEVRGHSDYERILPDLKDYHDISLKRSTLLAKFDPKMVQTVRNFDEWLANNGWATIADIKVYETDLIVNVGDEKTDFIFPEGAHEAYESALKNLFRKMVEGSGVPEILWGTKVEGNRASAEEQMDSVIKFVADKRAQKTDSYKQLFAATIALDHSARMLPGSEEEIKVEWNALDAISEKVKADIFLAFGQGVAALVNSAGVTKDQLFRLWRNMYPSATEDDYKKFAIGLSEMAKHKSFASTPYEIIADLEGAPGADTAGDETP